MDKLTPLQKLDLAQAVRKELAKLEYDATLRATYMNTRDRAIYGSGLFEGLNFPDGHDRTDYNLVKRVVDIHTSQLMGRDFQVYSNYDKEDLSLIEDNDQLDPQQKATELKMAELRNKKRAANADVRKQILMGIEKDNGGSSFWKRGAKVGSSYGETIIKQWADWDTKQVKRVVIETPSNVRFGWSDDNFREYDWVAFIYQMSKQSAYRNYSEFLPEGMTFESDSFGTRMNSTQNGNTSDPLDQRSADGIPTQSERDMVTCIDFTGYLEGWCVEKGELKECEPGDETKMSLLLVGGWLVQVIYDEKYLPTYYRVPNRELPQRSYGEADVTDSLISLNRTYIERMSDWITVANKTLFPLIMGKGFEAGTVPVKKARQMSVVPMDVDQTLEAVSMPNSFGFDYQQIINKIEDNLVRIAGIGRVLWDDPSINPTSNQALMTTFKGVIDIVEDKQSRWTPEIIKMNEDALRIVAKMFPDTKDAINEDGYELYVQWPSVLRKEDQSYQQNYLNRFQMNTISLRSYLEAMGVDNPSEEIDRLRDEINDPTIGAIITKQAGLLVQQKVAPAQPAGPDIKYNVSVKADATADPIANADLIRVVDPSLPDQGVASTAQNGATPSPQDTQNIQRLAEQNQPGTGMSSVAGSGAPAMSSQGAINQTAQQTGK